MRGHVEVIDTHLHLHNARGALGSFIVPCLVFVFHRPEGSRCIHQALVFSCIASAPEPRRCAGAAQPGRSGRRGYTHGATRAGRGRSAWACVGPAWAWGDAYGSGEVPATHGVCMGLGPCRPQASTAIRTSSHGGLRLCSSAPLPRPAHSTRARLSWSLRQQWGSLLSLRRREATAAGWHPLGLGWCARCSLDGAEGVVGSASLPLAGRVCRVLLL
jgi:hypothetical protein